MHWVRGVEEADALTFTYAPFAERRILMMFGASWDTASKELESVTFEDAAVRSLLNQHYIAAYVDFSDDEDPRTRKAQERFKILGTPVVLVFTPRFEREVVRLNEYVSPAELLARLSRA